MKLHFDPKLPEGKLRLKLPGELYRDLQDYQQYLAQQEQADRPLEEIALVVLRAFFRSGDRYFDAWKRGRKLNGKASEEGKERQEGGLERAPIGGGGKAEHA
jgi:hypothetical protein